MNINYLSKHQKEKLLQSMNAYFENAGLDDEHLNSIEDLLQRYPDGYLNLAYTTYGENDQFDIQVNFNLNKMRYEEWINLELYFNPNESYDRTFDDFCDEIASCDFDSMIRNCVQECADREENPERMYSALKEYLYKSYEKEDAAKEYRKVLWYLQHENGATIYDLMDFQNNYKKDVINRYYQSHQEPTNKMWTEYLSTIDSDIGGIKEFVAGLNKDMDGKDNQKDKYKAKGL
jgi:hypothetical protein